MPISHIILYINTFSNTSVYVCMDSSTLIVGFYKFPFLSNDFLQAVQLPVLFIAILMIQTCIQEKHSPAKEMAAVKFYIYFLHIGLN